MYAPSLLSDTLSLSKSFGNGRHILKKSHSQVEKLKRVKRKHFGKHKDGRSYLVLIWDFGETPLDDIMLFLLISRLCICGSE